jgi:hypothetical protein
LALLPISHSPIDKRSFTKRQIEDFVPSDGKDMTTGMDVQRLVAGDQINSPGAIRKRVRKGPWEDVEVQIADVEL